MKQFIFSIFTVFIFTSVIFSQSPDRIREEANMEYIHTPDNSEYAQLWAQQVAARKSGDMQEYNRISAEILQKYPNKFQGRDVSNQNVLRVINHQQPPFTPDWINGDITVYANAVGNPSPGNPNPIGRNIRVGADSLGNQYAAFLDANKDTIIVYKSTNQGQNWARIFSVFGTLGGYIHSFDMSITDSLNTFRLGFAITIETDGGPGFNGVMYWLSIDQSGLPISVVPIPPPAGRGYMGPSLISDGYSWSAANTFWYMTFQNCDTTTGVTAAAILAMSTNWGRTWVIDTARSSFNDYDLDVEYNFGADSIYVILTNNLTLTDENLRLRYVPLSGIGTGLTWKQSNTGATTGHDRLATLTANRQTNEMALLFTKFTGANPDIRLCYSPLGIGIVGAWTLDVPISNLPGDETNGTIECQESQGAYRLSFVSSGGGFDTVVYMSTFTLPNFGGRQVVNQQNTTAVVPDVVGFRNSGGFDGGVLYAGNNSLLYDGSAIITGVTPSGNTIPQTFSLEQNYPNPFNPATVIKFSVPQQGLVTLKIFDVTGREVAVLVNGEINAGVYKADFNASSLGSGVYFYKLTGSGFTETKKMILVK